MSQDSRTIEPKRWKIENLPSIDPEAHFGDRVVNCFSERAPSLDALFERACLLYPLREALVHGRHRLSYHELRGLVIRAARGFQAIGIQQGDRVVMQIANRIEFVVIMLALQRIAAIAVPVSIREQAPGLVYMIKQCSAKAAIIDAALPETLEGIRNHFANAPCQHEFNFLHGLTDDACAAFRLQDIAHERGEIDLPVVDVHEESCAFILYTSGTTGYPKGAMLSHLNIVHSVMHFQHCMPLRDGLRSILAVPASHVTGLIANLASVIACAGTSIIMSQFKAADYLQLAAEEQAEYSILVPAMYKLCLMDEAFDRLDLSRWRIGGYGGAPMPVSTIDELARRLPGLQLMNAYGATETCSPTTIMPARYTREHADSVGLVLPCAEVRVMNEAGEELPSGESGELWIRGPMVIPGYWDNPQANAANFTEGFWHSGDLGAIDREGFVYVHDRLKDMINRGGYKIFSVEVENCLVAYSGILEAAVISAPCPVLGERVHAVVYAPDLPQADQQARTETFAAITAHCKTHLADYKVPESIHFYPQALPRNANGKLLKRELKLALKS
ncbi:MAG: long-chain fatty acid--CoA ligase [Betaproteobacteria bacterium]|jgi:O-succinylbenzoic acid--CoA ligase|nr:long-chain fatty acid--CoA ligase [Betaproteobacteria bacterium]NBP33843.1 long-chain fatty acid--CoA ligase [Betaproteobacteria bacterium]NBP39268.1 long-chain fatty acid--CoA ligase [Betaproteobacteria bacterium]NBQ79313.1 long-chain fatty acid--CoA ligase [Betaproteobacteria bacterium]NBQ96229.1 long-chain fatty acid--CoA ligase [Betaproteobacteria bacterium]